MTSAPVPPRFTTARDPSAPTYGGAVDRIAGALGMPLMPWQRHVADVALEVDDEGLFRRSLVVLTVPRQSGKTSLLRAVMTHRALTVPRGGIWLTAQQRQDARDTWMDTATLLQTSPLASVVKVRAANGQEGVTFNNGAQLRLFNAGSDKALHGRTTDLVFIDEAFAFGAEQGAAILQAVMPTQATRPNGQVWLVSTAGTAASVWLREYVDRGREAVRDGTSGDVASRLAYFEWSIPDDTEDLTDLDVYEKHHPALGFTIGRRALTSAQEAMRPGEFARAYGNFWTSSAEWAIPPEVWDAARTTEPFTPGAPLAFAAEVSADRTGGVICAASRLADGRTAIEVVEARGGVGWIAPRMAELADRHRPVALVLDPFGPARPVHSALTEAARGHPVHEDFTAADFVAAHTELTDGLIAGRYAHRSHERLDAAVRAVQLRTVREVETFSRLVADDGTSPAALLAGMLAAWGLTHPADTIPAPRIYAVS